MVEARSFVFRQNLSKPYPEPTQPSPMGIRIFPRVKRTVRGVDSHLMTRLGQSKSYTYTTSLCLHGTLQGEFYLYR